MYTSSFNKPLFVKYLSFSNKPNKISAALSLAPNFPMLPVPVDAPGPCKKRELTCGFLLLIL